MDYEQIRYEVSDGIGLVTLNRPERRNAWTPRMAREKFDAVSRANADPDVRAIVVTGEGGSPRPVTGWRWCAARSRWSQR